MKPIVQIARVLTGLLFIFSGVIKLNDPSGFSIKLNEYFDVFAQDASAKQDTLVISFSRGAETLSSKSQVLYSFDKSRDLRLSTSFEPVTDTSGKVLQLSGRISLDLQGQTLASDDVSMPDSFATALYSVKATIAGKPTFQKSWQVSAAKVLDETHTLDLSEFVKPESALNGFFKWMKNWTLWLSIFVCSLEVILGFALLVGWKIRLTAWLLLLLILYFTFLTFYAAYFNKVTDCGCFGDFIKLKPWESFNKDIILTVLILIIFIGTKHIKPWFSKTFGWKFMGVITLLTVGFGVFCYVYLPVWDFLPYKKGNDIKKIMTEVPAGMRATDSIQMFFVMEKGTDSVRITADQYKKYADDGWKYRWRPEVVIEEGYKSPIHDFAISDPATQMDMKDSLLNYQGFQLVMAFPMVDNAYTGCLPETKEIWKWCQEKNIPFFPLTASAPDPAKEFTTKHKLDFAFYSSDQKMLLTMARYNPVLYLFNDAVVVDKWSGRNLPSVKKLEKLTRR